jgi:hypothetical protein
VTAAQEPWRKEAYIAHYDSFILRVWRSVGDQGHQWSGQLDHVQRRQSWRFTSLDDLIQHLRRTVDSSIGGIVIMPMPATGALEPGVSQPPEETESYEPPEEGKP